MNQPSGRERRRGARIKSKFWVRVPLFEERAEIRQGNISISGVFFEIDKALGKTGDVHTLSIATIDKSDSLSLMARLVRVVAIDDIWQERVAFGAAWEFLFENEQQRRNIERFVQRVATLQKKEAGNLEVAYQYRAQVDRQASGTHSALVTSVWLNGMLIETDWPVKEGEKLNVEIEAPASKKKMRLVGQAISSRKLEQAEAERYQVEVTFVRPESKVAYSSADTIAEAVDQLLSETAIWSAGMAVNTHEHLKGNLAQIRLSSLLAFFELERMSGVIRLEQKAQTARLYISEGRVIDALAGENWSVNPLELLCSLMRWTTGKFEFRVQKVERKDRIAMSTSALLIELARREDEHQR
ncbi:MAG: DUF4388 domain-containing protein [Deltaproteobacteria bacterium]|nr:DUF4388 domain-containing protein [Deltaproteobacteria bacterium]